MIKFDSHVHTLPFSPDSHQHILDVINRQSQLPYGVILTEHTDYDCPSHIKFEFDIDEYFKTYQPYRSDRLLLGVEMGLQESCLPRIAKDLKKYPFDMVIGSIHTIGVDISYPDFYIGKSKSESFHIYLDTTLNMIRAFPYFDTLAHVDYISRYCPYNDPEMYVGEFVEPLTAIFDEIISRGISLEINTRRLGNPESFRTAKELYRLYASRGGRYVTIGSDSHSMDSLAVNFGKAEEIINLYHLIPVYYKNRERME